jgi:hypothetical protein
MGLTSFEILDGGDVDLKDKEDKASPHELSTTMHYDPFSWDEGNAIEDVYHTMSSSSSSSFMIIVKLLVQETL